jgi:hypothetical protein
MKQKLQHKKRKNEYLLNWQVSTLPQDFPVAEERFLFQYFSSSQKQETNKLEERAMGPI